MVIHDGSYLCENQILHKPAEIVAVSQMSNLPSEAQKATTWGKEDQYVIIVVVTLISWFIITITLT